MKKGFTLLEILAVVTLVGLLFLIVLPKIVNSLKSKKGEIDQTINNMVVLAAKNYVNDNKNEFNKDDSNTYCLPISTLVKKEYLESPIKNITDDIDITNIKSVKITYDSGFKYEIVDKNKCNSSYQSDIYVDSFGNKYKRVDYIEGTGVQYIDTGYSAPKTIKNKFVVDFQLSMLTSSDQTIMGYDLNDAKINSNGYIQGNTSYPYVGLNRRKLTIEYTPTNNGSNHFITMDTDDGQHAERNSTYWPQDNNTKITMFTNSRNISSRMAFGKIYGAQIYENDVLVRNFIPVVDDLYIACMFDTVEKKCYYAENEYYFDSSYDTSSFKKNDANELLLNKKNSSGITDYTNGNIHQLYTFEHPATVQTSALTDYRYIANDPYNYIIFNYELWRIVGIFTVEDENGNMKQKIKLVKNRPLNNMVRWSESGDGDWNNSIVKNYLNGDYYNSISDKNKNLIETSKFYLASSLYSYSTTDFYNSERGNTVYENRSINCLQKIGLIYPSDYLYTFSLGVDDVCYNNGSNCDSSHEANPGMSWIYNNAYINNNYAYQWTITSSSFYSNNSYSIFNSGVISGFTNVNNGYYLFPSIYLPSDIKIFYGEGTKNNPYQIAF